MLRTFSWLPLLVIASHLHAEQIALDQQHFEHIHFKRIKPNSVTFNNNSVHFDVNNSASFLLLAFDDIKNVNAVSFQWKASGMMNKRSAQHEKTRSGDDAWLRIGLIIEGRPADIPEPLLPRWMKQVRKTLKHSSSRMVYLVPGALQLPGESWTSPFSKDVEMVSVGSTATGDDWKQVDHHFSQAQKTVGLWIMADGDNTNSIFNSQLRELVID